MKALFVFLLSALLFAQADESVSEWGTFPLTQLPLQAKLTTARIIQSYGAGQPATPYNNASLDVDQFPPTDLRLSGTLWVNLSYVHDVTQFIVNGWPSSVNPRFSRFTSDNPDSPVYQRNHFGELQLDFLLITTSDGKTVVIPAITGLQDWGNEFFNVTARPYGLCGKDGQYTKCHFPVFFAEFEQNCGFQVDILVVFDHTAKALGAYVYPTSSNCQYYEAAVYGFAPVEWTQHQIQANGLVRHRFNNWYDNRLPRKSINQAVPDAYAHQHKSGTPPPFDLENNAFNDPTVAPYHTMFNYTYRVWKYRTYYNHAYYMGPTESYAGRLPDYVARTTLAPVYSETKAYYLALTIAAIDQSFGPIFSSDPSVRHSPKVSIFNITFTKYLAVPSHWENVTIDMGLNMKAGHYNSTGYFYNSNPALNADELTVAQNWWFFYGNFTDKFWFTFFPKIHFPPNSFYEFVYTTPTMWAVALLADTVVRSELGVTLDELHKLLICTPLSLSPTYCDSVMTTGPEKIPLGGYGTYMTDDDFGHIAEFFVSSYFGKLNGKQIVSANFFTKQQPIDPNYQGAYTNWAGARPADNITVFECESYSHGVWRSKKSGMIAYVSGYGDNRDNFTPDTWDEHGMVTASGWATSLCNSKPPFIDYKEAQWATANIHPSTYPEPTYCAAAA